MCKLHDFRVDWIKFLIVCLFTILELVSFKSNKEIQLMIAFFEYLFIIIHLLIDFKKALFYFVSFTILALGQENFIDIELPYSFWGIRLGPLSFNLCFTLYFFIFGLLSRKFIFNFKSQSLFVKFYIYLFIYSSLLGLVLVFLGSNYFDNYISDFFSFGIFIIYLTILNYFDFDLIKKILTYTLISSLLGIIFFYFFDAKYSYGEGGDFLLSNSFWFIMPVVFFFTKDLFNSKINITFLLLIFWFISHGYLFVGGKHIILLFLVLMLLFFRYSKLLFFGSLYFILIYYNSFFIWVIDYFSDNVISYKFSQIFNSISYFDFELIASTKSSIGNIFAEFQTLFTYSILNPFIFLFGVGLGSGIPDIYGYLAPGAGNSAYAGIDLLRNNYHKMHLPMFEIFLKTGIVGLYLFVYNFWFYFKKSIKYWPFIFSFFFVFYVTKELMLLTILFYLYAEKSQIVNNAN